MAARSQAENAIQAYNDALLILTDPRSFASKWLDGTVRKHALREIDWIMGIADGITATSDIQDAYDYLFGNVQNALRYSSTNPIINAISAESAERIRMMFSDTLNHASQLSTAIEQIGAASFGSKPEEHSMPKRVAPSRAECAILDSAQRIELAIEQPEEFESLVARCGN